MSADKDSVGAGESIGRRLQEIACDCRDARRTEAAARDVCQQRITVLLNALRSDLCCDHTRHISQHPDIGGRKLCRHGCAEIFHGSLCGTVCCPPRIGVQCCEGRSVQNHAAPLRLHVRIGSLCPVKYRGKVQVDLPSELLAGHFHQRLDPHGTGVIDPNVNGTVLLRHCGGKGLHLFQICHIRLINEYSL